jgi:hypothetical protein
MKKISKRLILNNETIRNLAGTDLNRAAGGISRAGQCGTDNVGCQSDGCTGGVTCNSVNAECPSGPGIATCTCTKNC